MIRCGIVTGLMILTAASAKALPTAPADQIRVAIGSDVRSTEPGVNRDSITDDVINHIVEPLVAYREDLSVGPVLASDIRISEDGREYSFRLRDNVRFHNGALLTAVAAKWSIDRILAPSSRFQCRNWYDGSEGLKIVAVEAVDRLTLRLRLNRPDGLFLNKLANFQCLVGIVHPASVAADGRWRQPVGTGPYVIRQWRRGRDMLLERFAGYRPRAEAGSGYAGGRRPLIRQIRWMVIPDPASARAALYADQVDLIGNIDAADLDDLRAHSDVQVHVAPSLDWNALLVQTRDPVLADPLLRRAIAHAIDRKGLAAAVTAGISGPNPSAVFSDSRYFSPVQRTAPAYDPAVARRLLKRSRYAGTPIRIVTNRRYPHMFDNAIYLQAMLKRIGIAAELDVTEWATQLSRYLSGDFQLMTFGFSARTDPALSYASFLGDRGKHGWAQWQSPQARTLLDRASMLRDPAARQPLFDAVHRLMLRDMPIYPLFNHYVMQATRNRVLGYRPWSANRIRLWDVRLAEGRGGA